jgi:DNA-binding IclR family transcriptional regulator
MKSTTTSAGDQVEAAISRSQTLMRGLDVIEQVAHETLNLVELTERIGLTKTTTHRLASALVTRGYLAFTPRLGYRLGPKLLELGFLAQSQTDLIQVARPHLEALSDKTEDTVHLGVIEADQALYLDKTAGKRRIMISSRVGDRQPLTSTGLGKALMLDHPESYWQTRLAAEQDTRSAPADFAKIWLERMKDYVAVGRAYDLEENEDQIRCVAVPVRDASGGIVAAISVSSAAQYMSDERMAALTEQVRTAAHAISHDLGWALPEKPAS